MTFTELVASTVTHDVSQRSLRLAIEENRIRRSGKTPIRPIPLRVAQTLTVESRKLQIGDLFEANGAIVYQVVE